MSLALERFQSASRTVRLTTPPARHEAFWGRLTELAVQKERGLAITLLLPASPDDATPLIPALRALRQLERSGHEVGWSANEPLPFSLILIDDLWALVIAGDPEAEDGSGYLRLTDDSDEVRQLRDAFDRRVARGVGGLDPRAWLEWLEQAPHRQPTRTALAALHRGEKKLSSAVKRALKKMPRRGFWIVKPHDSAYGMSEPPGQNHWGEWVVGGRVSIGLPRLGEQLGDHGLPQKNSFAKRLRSAYPGFHDTARAYATFRYFLSEMLPGDRIAAMDGWTSSQTTPVRFHGWGRVDNGMRHDMKYAWPLGRPADWQRYEVEIPVSAVRQATGLASCTYPIHRLGGHAFRALVDLAEEVQRSVGQSQLALELTLLDRLSQQQELL